MRQIAIYNSSKKEYDDNYIVPNDISSLKEIEKYEKKYGINVEKGKKISLYKFEEKQSLIELLNDNADGSENTGIQVYIGDESPISTMKDCSIVTATYELGDGVKGTIGIVGPKRMDYEKVVGTLRDLMHQLDTIYKNQ